MAPSWFGLVVEQKVLSRVNSCPTHVLRMARCPFLSSCAACGRETVGLQHSSMAIWQHHLLSALYQGDQPKHTQKPPFVIGTTAGD
jgi:hypothetical protein